MYSSALPWVFDELEQAFLETSGFYLSRQNHRHSYTKAEIDCLEAPAWDSFHEGDGQIRLEGQDPTLVEKTLEFLYTGNYTYDPPEDAEMEPLSEGEIELFSGKEGQTSIANPRTGRACFHAQMYAQGDYFQINALKWKAKEYFKEHFMESLRFLPRDSYTAAVIEVYSSTAENDRGLRDLVVQLTTNNLPLLREVDPILDSNLLEGVPSFMRDICLSAVERCVQLQRDHGDWCS
ncbi:hypothetical protein Aspvir_007947 [Aspergillus viridinutans]|uniref:BTB domain-containing protein n=1 Tax=Aspergillus viridinutans TaxID=75553 RepID=A0A9P3C1H0_ASPVI|nr:uncharacterized protein Aspvir_007947 [Aspergillus viridinutans]GIK03872.1 hypothetical protein Aspvir_007947 [Aspergillus viridinutans]